ncbi:MAG: type II toxin-antitoxin system HicA family toxin [bacterium]|nr:type II toxin-antitoxin system HicA family toxin [bacterium]
MPKLPRAREVVRIAQKLGFIFSRQKGSHAIYKRKDGVRITVPVHQGKEISPAVFNQILKDLNISKASFWKL